MLLTLVFLSACGPAAISPPAVPEELESGPAAYFNQAGDRPLLQFIWLQLPEELEGRPPIARVFIAREEPSQPVVPAGTNIKCLLTSPDQQLELGPVSLPLAVQPDGTFQGVYRWPAIAECDPGYMAWEYTLQFKGVFVGDEIMMELAVVHPGHNVQGAAVRVALSRAQAPPGEPHLRCDMEGSCGPVFFVSRPAQDGK